MMKIAGILTILFFIASSSEAAEVYKNPEYRFSIALSDGEKICSGDLHGISISLGRNGCAAHDGYMPVTLWVDYNSQLESRFPTISMRQLCFHVQIERTKLNLGANRWYSCEVKRGSQVRIYFFNFAKARLTVQWRWFGVEVRMSEEKYVSLREEIDYLIQKIRLTDGG